MNSSNNGLYFKVLLMCFVIATAGCKKNKNNTDNNGFIKTYSFPDGQFGTYLKQTEDNNILLFWVNANDTTYQYSRSSQISKIDLNGNVIWQKNLEGNFESCKFMTLADGTIVGTNGYSIIKMDNNGNVLFREYSSMFPSYVVSDGFAVQPSNGGPYAGHFMMAGTNGSSRFAPSTNQVSILNPNGKKVKDSFVFLDTDLNCKVLQMDIYAYEEPGTFYLRGTGMLNWTGDWTSNQHIFFAKIELNADRTLKSKKVVLVDSADNLNTYNSTYQGETFQSVDADKSVLMSINRLNKFTGITNGHLIMMDASMNVVWKKNVPFEGSNSSILGIEKCPDGGFLVVGSTTATNTNVSIPFYCKYDKFGTLIWKNTLRTPQQGFCAWGIQLNDGKFMFTGNTRSFGNGNIFTNSDLLLIKTDNLGFVK